MVNGSNVDAEKNIESFLVRGNILRLQLYLPQIQKKKFKRIIILNRNFTNDDVFYILTTTKTSKFINNKYPEIAGNFILVPKGTELNNPKEDVVIDCRTVFPIKKSELQRCLSSGKLDLIKKVSNDLLDKIDRKIRISALIADEIKEKVL